MEVVTIKKKITPAY